MEATEWWAGLTRAATPAPEYEGATFADAQAKAAALGIDVRAVHLSNTPTVIGLTMDLRSDRLTLLVREGVVVRAAMF